MYRIQIPHTRGSIPKNPGRQVKTVNLHAKSDFEKGDRGRIQGHTVVKADTAAKGEGIVTALQDVRAGGNGWFEVQAA